MILPLELLRGLVRALQHRDHVKMPKDTVIYLTARFGPPRNNLVSNNLKGGSHFQMKNVDNMKYMNLVKSRQQFITSDKLLH